VIGQQQERAVRAGPVAGINPVAKLAAALLIALPLVLTIDAVSAAVALGLSSILFVLSGVRWREFWLRTLPVWIAAPLTAVTIALYGQASGTVYVEWFVVRISEGSLELAVATFFRVLAIALPGIVLFVTVDPTDLADGLAQIVRLPSRFVLGALAGMRMLGLLADDWRALALARRARGVADEGRVRRVLGMAFALFVLAIRRGTKLATAMEARGFGGMTDSDGRAITRTWARESCWGAREWVLVAAGAAISATALSVAIAVGSWNFILGPA
jgi:energy-coupling factor transport system permease protein